MVVYHCISPFFLLDKGETITDYQLVRCSTCCNWEEGHNFYQISTIGVLRILVRRLSSFRANPLLQRKSSPVNLFRQAHLKVLKGIGMQVPPLRQGRVSHAAGVTNSHRFPLNPDLHLQTKSTPPSGSTRVCMCDVHVRAKAFLFFILFFF